MSRNVGRHRTSRRGGAQLLRRPAVLTSAAIATVSMSATAYASTSGAIGASNTDALTRSALPTAPATANSAADTAAKIALMKRAAAARGSVTSRSMARQASLAALARANQAAAQKSGTAARQAAAAKKAAAAQKAAAAAAAAKQAAASKAAAARQVVTTQPSPPATAPAPAVSGGNPQAIAASMLSSYGWDSGQMSCLVSLWNKESGWNPSADNASSGAYGIPQSLPGSKMASAGADWRTNPATQIKWGLGYIKSSYGSPCGAWAHSQATNWY